MRKTTPQTQEKSNTEMIKYREFSLLHNMGTAKKSIDKVIFVTQSPQRSKKNEIFPYFIDLCP